MQCKEWVLEPGLILAVEGASSAGRYEINLERLTTSARVLEWITYIASQPWATDRVLAGVVRALDRHLSLHTNYCRHGFERGPVNVAKVLLRERTRSITDQATQKAAVSRPCPRCGGSIDETRMRDARGRAWHPDCAEAELAERPAR